MDRPQLDELTGARTRAELKGLLAALRNRAVVSDEPFAVAMLDLDHLKTVNDVYGHAAGDEAIRTIALRTMHALRSEDLLFRYGGDEFVVVLPATREAEAAAVMRRVRNHVIADPVQAGSWITLSLSIGVAGSDGADVGFTVDELLARADERLYAAKRSGRNTLVAKDGTHRTELNFAGTRLFGQDAAISQLDAFLAREASSSGSRADRVARLLGPDGAGFTRVMNEVEVRARLAGKAVRHINGEQTHANVHLRALEVAFAQELSADPSEENFAALLRQEAEAHGLVLLVEGGKWLDPASMRVITQRLEAGGALLLEALVDGEQGAFGPGRDVQLERLGIEDARNWLAAAGVGQAASGLVQTIHSLGDGLPGRIARIVTELRAGGALRTVDGRLTGDIEEVQRLTARMDFTGSGVRPKFRDWGTPLVGRTRLIETLLPALRSSRLVTLTGPGGVGKTRMAAQLGLELAADSPDGTAWVDLRAVRSVGQVPRAIAEALELDSTDDLEVIKALLKGQKHRLIMDEVDAIADEAGVLAELLSELPDLRLLLTSRMPLRISDELVIEVPELADNAALELLRQGMTRAGTVVAVGDAELEALVARTGSSPLALEMAAAWTRALTVEELTGALDAQPELLVEAPGLKPRTTRLIDVTRQLMSEREQEMLGVLTLIPAGFTAEAATEAAGASPFFLLALLERSLMRREGSRYTVHAAIAERFRAGLRDPDAARSRVARTWSALARRITAMKRDELTAAGYRKADAEMPNLVVAWQYLLERQDTELLWPLARLLRGYCDLRARRYQALELFTLADSQLAECNDVELRAWVRECLALYSIQLQRPEESREHIRTALELIADIESETTALIYNTAGMIVHMQPETDAALAIEYFGRSADLRARLGDAIGEAQARGNQAYVLADSKRPAEAQDALLGAVNAYRELGLKSGLVLAIWRLVGIYREFGLVGPAEALDLAMEGLEAAEAIGFTHGAKISAEQCGDLLEDLKDLRGAAAMCERAADWSRREDGADDEARLLGRAGTLRERALRSLVNPERAG